MNNRGQASLEYLFTYGWALLGIMIAIGALMYFGVFDTDNLRGRECTFPPGVTCQEFQLGDAQVDDSLALDLRNTYGATINVTQMRMDSDALGDNINCDLATGSIPGSGYVWEQENITRFVCTPPSTNYYEGDTYEMIVTINFTQANHTYPHYTKGTVVATAQ